MAINGPTSPLLKLKHKIFSSTSFSSKENFDTTQIKVVRLAFIWNNSNFNPYLPEADKDLTLQKFPAKYPQRQEGVCPR